MEEEDNNSLERIPEEFYSFSTGKPFENCVDCNKYLLDGELYVIEKAIKQYKGFSAKDVVFEYAICLDCADRMKAELSKESLQNIQFYFESNLNPENFRKGKSMEGCIMKNTSKNELTEYQIYAYCEGANLSPLQPPFLVSGAVMEEISHLLSDKTTDELNRFMDRHFGPPPEWMEDVPASRKLIFI